MVRRMTYLPKHNMSNDLGEPARGIKSETERNTKTVKDARCRTLRLPISKIILPLNKGRQEV